MLGKYSTTDIRFEILFWSGVSLRCLCLPWAGSLTALPSPDAGIKPCPSWSVPLSSLPRIQWLRQRKYRSNIEVTKGVVCSRVSHGGDYSTLHVMSLNIFFLNSRVKTLSVRAGKMAQCFRALAALPEDSGLVISINISHPQPSITLISENRLLSSGFCRNLDTSDIYLHSQAFS